MKGDERTSTMCALKNVPGVLDGHRFEQEYARSTQSSAWNVHISSQSGDRLTDSSPKRNDEDRCIALLACWKLPSDLYARSHMVGHHSVS